MADPTNISVVMVVMEVTTDNDASKTGRTYVKTRAIKLSQQTFMDSIQLPSSHESVTTTCQTISAHRRRNSGKVRATRKVSRGLELTRHLYHFSGVIVVPRKIFVDHRLHASMLCYRATRVTGVFDCEQGDE